MGKIKMPMSEGGLVRYGEETDSLIKVKPEFVIALCAVVIVLFTLFNIFT
jgi:preprotein translocase subunit Sec61beta